MQGKKRNKKGMTAPRNGGGEGLLETYRRAQPEADTSGKLHSGHDPELCEQSGRGRERGTRCSSQEAQKRDLEVQVTKIL